MTRYHGLNNLRLEVEVPSTTLPNLVKNPSGAKGAWFWVTPVANTAMETAFAAPSESLKFTTSISQACHFTTDYMPVTATRWVAARLDVIDMSGSGHNIRVRFEWYDANKALLSSSAQSAAISTTGGGYGSYIPSVQAPASTAFVKMRVDFYNGVGNPAAGAFVTFRRAMVTWNTVNTFTSNRTNLITNPSFEVNTAGWTSVYVGGGSAPTFARSSAQAHTGAWSYAITTTSVTSYAGISTTATGVVGGETYAGSFRLRSTALTGTPGGYLSFRWFDATGAQVSTSPGNGMFRAFSSTTAWKDVAYQTVAPYNATSVVVEVGVIGLGGSTLASGLTHYIDAVLFERCSEISPYFDGSAGGTWTGTAHASTSTQVSTNYYFADTYAWRNILGPTFEIKVGRSGLDLGIMSAKISDPTLDPASTTDIRPGKQVRLRALVDDDWTSVAEGRLTKALVDYENPRTIITLAAVDNAATGANRKEARGVATVADLPYLLEDKGIPWNCNGSGDQVTTATVVSANENASVVDQVAITRDTVLGYAWVDRSNVLQVWDSASIPATVEVTYSDVVSADPAFDAYSRISADFDTGRCINEVTVKWLRYNANTATTEEVVYGPYRDQASIDQWGPFRSEFTIHGAIEDPSAIASYAAAVLAANGTPQRRANAITVPVRDARSLKHAALVDLYSLVHVTYSDKVDEDYRVTGISHTITPDKWLVSYDFETTDSVASPTLTPSVPPGALDSGWHTATVASPFTASTPAPAYRRSDDGTVFIRGAVNRNAAADGALVFTLPVGYRPVADTRFINDTSPVATSSMRCIISASDGGVRLYVKTGVYTLAFLDCCFSSV